ncbi:homocysteine S-methyltransferase [Selenomonas sp. TAMA-11512]|uniref:homocysteine S-methyltransferase n=1 Tax=Selenomonas sp. TAMA-11512 TaxID=3095337 RepID=UPI00308CA135|nr:homocysteine S-methyltransferase [Selenomonas sp. TAMA-11512]
MLTKLLQKYPFLVLDGAFGTEITNRGFDTNDELWAAKALFERPELVRSVHYDYYRAGADIVSSASYQASVEGFEKKGYSRSESKKLIQDSVALVRAARDAFLRDTADTALRNRPAPLAAASVGPYGAYLADGSEYRGDYTLSRAELSDFHEERLALLIEAQPDLLAFETLPLLDEALVLVSDLKRRGDAAAWCSFSCKDEKHISSGEPIAEAARILDKEPQIVAIGLNCTAPDYVTSLIREIRSVSDKPIVVYPNTGETYNAVTKTWHGAATSYTDYVKQWHEAGARLIGGCCRTTPDTIRDIAGFRKTLM